jgi:heme A synthase
VQAEGDSSTARIQAGAAAISLKIYLGNLVIATDVPIAIATMHAGYALGLAYAMLARVFFPSAWDTQSSHMASISR